MENAIQSSIPALAKLSIEEGGLLSGRYWGELRTFLAVAKAKSLNRAAQELGVSRMTAGREIRRLQDAVGAQLIVFGKSGAGLTGRGEELARGLLRLDQDIHMLTNDLRSEATRAEGTVRVGLMDVLGVIFVAPGLRTLTQAYPRIRVATMGPRTPLSLIENQADITVGFVREVHPDLTSAPLGTLHYRPIVSRHYVERRGAPSYDNIERHDFVDSPWFSSKAETWTAWRRLVARGYVSHSCEAPFAYEMTVKAGLGIGLLGNFNVMDPALLPVDLDCAVAIPLFLTALTERLRAKPVRIVFDFVRSLLGSDNPWLADDMRSDAGCETPFDAGYRSLFNL